MQTKNALAKLAKCYEAPDKINPKKLNDDFAFLIAITTVENAIKAGEITEEEVEKVIKGEANCGPIHS